MGKSNKGRASKSRARMAHMVFGGRAIESRWDTAYRAAIARGASPAQAERAADKTLGTTKREA